MPWQAGAAILQKTAGERTEVAGLRKKVELATASPVGVTRRLLPQNAFRKSSPSSTLTSWARGPHKKRTEAKVVAGLRKQVEVELATASPVGVTRRRLPPRTRLAPQQVDDVDFGRWLR